MLATEVEAVEASEKGAANESKSALTIVRQAVGLPLYERVPATARDCERLRERTRPRHHQENNPTIFANDERKVRSTQSSLPLL